MAKTYEITDNQDCISRNLKKVKATWTEDRNMVYDISTLLRERDNIQGMVNGYNKRIADINIIIEKVEEVIDG